MLNWWADQGRLAQVFAPAVELTPPLWIGDGRFDEGAEWLRRVAAVVPDDPDLRVRYDMVVCWLAAYRGDPDVRDLSGQLLRSAEADGVTVPARLLVSNLVITGIAGLGIDARPYADARVEETRSLSQHEPDSEQVRELQALALGFRGAARGAERDLEGALADYETVLEVPDRANLALWVGIGQIAYLHLLGRNDEAIARAAEVARNPEAGAAEWARQLAAVTADRERGGRGLGGTDPGRLGPADRGRARPRHPELRRVGAHRARRARRAVRRARPGPRAPAAHDRNRRRARVPAALGVRGTPRGMARPRVRRPPPRPHRGVEHSRRTRPGRRGPRHGAGTAPRLGLVRPVRPSLEPLKSRSSQ